MTRQLGIERKFDLSAVGDGWQDCYVTYRPATVSEVAVFQTYDPKSMSEQDSLNVFLGFIRDHYLGGRVRVTTDGGPFEVIDMEASDLDQLPTQTLQELFADMSGVSTDPKASGTEVPSGTTPSSDAAPIVTQ